MKLTRKRRMFLPRYAESAVAAFRWYGERMQEPSAGLFNGVALALESATHVILPDNGSIYRDSCAKPSTDEIESLVGLPGPITALQYSWTLPVTSGSGKQCPKRITLCINGDELGIREGVVAVYSILYDSAVGGWTLSDGYVVVWMDGSGQIPFHMYKQEPTSPTEPHDIALNMAPDVSIATQFCHAIRAGAQLHHVEEISTSRRRKMKKTGRRGFEYHELVIPYQQTEHRGKQGGTHSSPRLHVRRAHIRKLPTGAYTFVRQCLVGSICKGIVAKHYKVKSP